MNEKKPENKIKLLLIEDSEDDAKLILRNITKSGFDVSYELVQTKERMESALNTKQFDLIISDYNLPEFNGIEAVRLIRKLKIDIPFILVSGVVGEEVAVEAMKQGANDYIMKSSLKRLAPAIEREINEYSRLKSAEQEKQKSIELSIEAERKKNEAMQLIDNASKLASIGIITSAITHEINQPLNAIRLGTDFILLWNKKNDDVLPEKMTNMIAKISEAADRIDEVIKHMRLLIVNDNNVELTKVDLNSCIGSAVSLISNKVASQEISLDYEYDKSELYIKANQLQIELIVNNLIQNAAQSILESNTNNKRIKLKTYKIDNKIFLEVRDSGAGLPEVPVNNLFDPMFSTKKHKGGTGLGLAIVKRFLSKINAEITACNNVDAGATFKIEFLKYDKGIDN